MRLFSFGEETQLVTWLVLKERNRVTWILLRGVYSAQQLLVILHITCLILALTVSMVEACSVFHLFIYLSPCFPSL